MDKGNPNVFTVFRGRYALTMAEGASGGNENVMLTCVNDVQFMATYTANASGELFTLPEACRPSTAVYVACYSATTDAVEFVRVLPTGAVSGKAGYAYSLSGCSFNISGNYY